jgi:hypothetical protein
MGFADRSRPPGFDPRAHSVLLAGGTRAKGSPVGAIAIAARRAGALLTGLATALAVGSRRSGVAITVPKAVPSFPPPLRRRVCSMWRMDICAKMQANEASVAPGVTLANPDGANSSTVTEDRIAIRRSGQLRTPYSSNMSGN